MTPLTPPLEAPPADTELGALPGLLGVDFTSAPSARKPITVARGRLSGHGPAQVLRLERIDTCERFSEWEALLDQPGPWLGAFDFPFGLPRAFVGELQLGDTADEVIRAVLQRCPDRMAFRALVDAWGQGRPAGQRLVHRRTDLSLPGLRSTSPLQTRYVPVGFMYYEGFSRLVRAGVTAPGLRRGDDARVAVEGYPALLAHELIGARSYKNADQPDRLIARKDIVEALEQGRSRLGLRLKFTHGQRDQLVADVSGDRLDAVLCLAQAAWAASRPGHGLSADADPVEGWIVSA
ncbi:MAG: DUF429 domain-containing protein [Rubrivivax sp.]